MKTTITFDPIEGISLHQSDGLSETVKTIQLEDLKEVFANNIPMETGMLPRNCIFMARKEVHTVVLLEIPATKHSILFRPRHASSVQRFEVPLPTVVFGLHYNQGVLAHSYCATTQLPVTSLDVPTFRFPLGNVYDDTRICWGNVSHNPIQSVQETSEISPLFFAAPFNGDLSGGAYNYEGDLTEFINHLVTQQFFPPNYLVSNNSNTTVGAILNKLKRDAGMS